MQSDAKFSSFTLSCINILHLPFFIDLASSQHRRHHHRGIIIIIMALISYYSPHSIVFSLYLGRSYFLVCFLILQTLYDD